MLAARAELERRAAEAEAQEFHIHRVAEVDLGTGHRLKVSLTFRNGDWQQPLDVTFFDPDTSAMVSIPAAMWQLIADRIAADWEQ